MNQSENAQPGRPDAARRRQWLWLTAAVAVAAAVVAMYVYEKSLEDDLEAMLRSALQQYEADSAAAEGRAAAPDPNEGAERG
jgi:type VI protein secretion system component VasF